MSDRKTPELRRAASIVRKLADALAYAHSKGVIHRDVKPANAMLDEQGEPMLLDFGLAARPEEEEKLTQEGAMMGTPAYMAPEQALGKAGPASDQYSLGCTLYEMLTGQTPFAGPPEIQLVLHQTHEPPSPRSVNPRLPRDLETICLRCLAKEPERRYADCQALADDLRRWLDGEPITARRLSMGERLVRWAKKEPKLAAAAALAAGLLVAVAVVAAINARQQREFAAKQTDFANKQTEYANKQKEDAQEQSRLRKKADDEKEKTKEEKDRAEYQEYLAKIQLAQSEWNSPQWPRAQEVLESCSPKWRGWEHHYLYTLFHHHGQYTLRGHSSVVSSVAFSPDGARLASGGRVEELSGALSGELKVWDARTGQEILSLKGHRASVNSVAFSPDGARVASGSVDSALTVWDARTGQEILSLKGHSRAVVSVVFSPDGARLASASKDGTVRLWDARTGQEMLSLSTPEGENFLASPHIPKLQRLVPAAGSEAGAIGAESHAGY